MVIIFCVLLGFVINDTASSYNNFRRFQIYFQLIYVELNKKLLCCSFIFL